MNQVMIKNIDLKLLKKQKESLVEVIYDLEQKGKPQHAKHLEGILNLLDAIQDKMEDH